MALTTDGPQPLRFADSRGNSTPLSTPHAPMDDTTFFGPMTDSDACLIERDESMPDLVSSDGTTDDDDDKDANVDHAASTPLAQYQTALQTEWLLDCAAHSHCTSNPSILHEIQDLPQPISLHRTWLTLEHPHCSASRKGKPPSGVTMDP